MREATPGIEAYACHPTLGNEVATGRLVIESWRLRFESDRITFEIPIVRLHIERENGRISFCDEEQPDCLVYTFEPRVLKHPQLLQQSHTRNQISALQSGADLSRRLKITFGLLAGAALIALVISILTGVMVRSLVSRIPAKWEKEFGDSLVEEIKLNEKVVQDPKLKKRLDFAVAPLMAAQPKTGFAWTFYVIDDPIPNAFALPGGHVFVNSGLLNLAEEPAEVAGVVAHEMAHVNLKHGFRKIISAAGPFLVFRVFLRQGNGLLGVLGDGSQLLINQSYSQSFELEADATGWEYLAAAQIDPRGLAQMLTKLRSATFMKGLELGAFSSHPPTQKRVDRLNAKWVQLKNKSAFVENHWPSEREP